MGMSISGSRASTAPVSQPLSIAPPPPPPPPTLSADGGLSSVDDIASELLSLNTDGTTGRYVNQKA